MSFPAATTTVGNLLANGKVSDARLVIMDRYRLPLQAYVRGFPWYPALRELPKCETDLEIVHEFFSRKLSSDERLLSWSPKHCRLRYWLLSVMGNFMRQLLGELQQSRRNAERLRSRHVLNVFDDSGPQAEYRKACRIMVVKEAIAAAGQAAIERGKGDVWQAFLRRKIFGDSYATLTPFLDKGANLNAGTIRLMQSLLAEAIRKVVAWPGASEREIDSEIEDLLDG